MSDFIQVQITYPDEATAQTAATTLVEQRLAACVQVLGPITSHYYWEERLERSAEWTCTIKTRKTLFDLLAKTIRAHHPYDCPQIIAIPIVDCDSSYGDWLLQQTREC
ncbi:MAG TPA: cytochrome C biogenesis protein CcdA [Planctomycetaceae bacterium]|nr:cytochrome C biogenesis protein CcdA [Planctomycetaceae bacterium]